MGFEIARETKVGPLHLDDGFSEYRIWPIMAKSNQVLTELIAPLQTCDLVTQSDRPNSIGHLLSRDTGTSRLGKLGIAQVNDSNINCYYTKYS